MSAGGARALGAAGRVPRARLKVCVSMFESSVGQLSDPPEMPVFCFRMSSLPAREHCPPGAPLGEGGEEFATAVCAGDAGMASDLSERTGPMKLPLQENV